jgi:hypothetical protein
MFTNQTAFDNLLSLRDWLKANNLLGSYEHYIDRLLQRISRAITTETLKASSKDQG